MAKSSWSTLIRSPEGLVQVKKVRFVCDCSCHMLGCEPSYSDRLCVGASDDLIGENSYPEGWAKFKIESLDDIGTIIVRHDGGGKEISDIRQTEYHICPHCDNYRKEQGIG